jgi:hypothetical protein
MRQSRISRVTGYKPLTIGQKGKRGIASSILSVPLAIVAMVVCDGALLSDTFCYVVSPGSMFALRFVGIRADNRGFEAFLDILGTWGLVLSLSFVINAIFYALLIFGLMTIVSASGESKPT